MPLLTLPQTAGATRIGCLAMAAGVFHLCSYVIQSIGVALRAKFVLDAGDRVAKAVAQGPLSAGFLHSDRNFQLRLGEDGVSFLGEVHHIAIGGIAESPARFLRNRCAAFAA